MLLSEKAYRVDSPSLEVFLWGRRFENCRLLSVFSILPPFDVLLVWRELLGFFCLGLGVGSRGLDRFGWRRPVEGF